MSIPSAAGCLFTMIEFLSRPWPWYVVGALLGGMAPLLLLVGNKQLGVSGNLRTLQRARGELDVRLPAAAAAALMCLACAPSSP